VEFLWKFGPILEFVVFFNQLHQLLRKFYLKNQAQQAKKKVITSGEFRDL